MTSTMYHMYWYVQYQVCGWYIPHVGSAEEYMSYYAVTVCRVRCDLRPKNPRGRVGKRG
jgi:hypothetical protein